MKMFFFVVVWNLDYMTLLDPPYMTLPDPPSVYVEILTLPWTFVHWFCPLAQANYKKDSVKTIKPAGNH